ncbi:MAG: D-Ala-D-Ala carboxypeptidase family metallohydrolase [Pseudomonadota bacterium]
MTFCSASSAKNTTVSLLLGACCTLLLAAPSCLAWDSRLLQHPVLVDGLGIAQPVMAVFRLPGGRLHLQSVGGLTLVEHGPELSISKTEQGLILQLPDRSGWYPVIVRNNRSLQEFRLNAYAMVPITELDKRGYLGGFRVGVYPPVRNPELTLDDPPEGFIELTEATRDIRVSPNFTLAQFACKQAGGYPKYIVLRPELMLKLERLLRAVNEAGHVADTLHVMSGYRTPFYNRAIGNSPYSRHLWGGAADIFVDAQPEDGVMDDLNGDGALNKHDALWLAELIENLSSAGNSSQHGGLGSYGSNAAHGPFVHVDVRGYRARW